MPFGRYLLLLLLGFSSISPALADVASFRERCDKLATEAKFKVVFADKNFTRDDTRSVDELKRIAGSSPANQNHSVLGVTHAEPAVNLDLSVNSLTNADGKVCAVPSFTLNLHLASFAVYLAKELGNPCRKAIVDEHEQEHVAVWRNHLRAGAQLAQVLLQRKLAGPHYFDDRASVDAGLHQRIDEQVSVVLNSIKQSIQIAHQQIDSPSSYGMTERRLRACP
jgi:hypothetical protein